VQCSARRWNTDATRIISQTHAGQESTHDPISAHASEIVHVVRYCNEGTSWSNFSTVSPTKPIQLRERNFINFEPGRRGRARARTNFCLVRLRKNQRFHHPMFDRPVYSKHTINDVRIYRRYHSRHLQIKKAGTFFPLSKKSPSAQREKLSATWTEREPQRKASWRTKICRDIPFAHAADRA
jgi:hypothetical protein